MKLSEIFKNFPIVFSRFGKEYEERKEQVDYAWAIYNALEKRDILLIEAETGIGKTLGYLLPAILYAKKYNKRIIISTYTKVLQNQILNSDILLAKEILGIDFFYAVAYGRENYICKRRIKQTFNYQLFDFSEEKERLNNLYQQLNAKSEININFWENLPPSLKEKINCVSEACLNEECSYYYECFYQRARWEWRRSDILIVNHALFFANLKYPILPEYQGIIFDEAHSLEDVCANSFGFSITENGLKSLIFRLYNPKTKVGLLKILKLNAKKFREYQKEIFYVLNDLNDYFQKLKNFLKDEKKKRIKGDLTILPNFLAPLQNLKEQINEEVQKIDNKEITIEFIAWKKEVEEKIKNIEEFYKEKDNFVFWLAEEENSLSLNSALIDVQEVMKQNLYNKEIPIIFTSATLRIKEDFHFFASRLGIEKYDKKYFPSPFDYSQQALVYIEKNIPLPTEEEPFYEKAAKIISDIIHHAKGRTLVLFTSFKALKRVYELCDKTRYPILIQEENSSTIFLLSEFQKNINASLFATGSFWQGIDVPGESLSCLIITRLPFDVPDEPRIEGIKEKLKKENLDPFWYYQLPNAVLKFRQGFGRLIRSKEDYGAIVILDKRIIEKSYGKYFLKSLPKSVKNTENINLLINFLKNVPTKIFRN
ncbi:MAG: ATP-dependent DNA helicase [candidate division WOR-3 bacterium]|nr:ATP-dependent DNA helicase [candidate division WOR-3 bacterium]MCX7836366.1 ATP-dependent DNA helicase [candidate division WOR-3 bacterium]MDW8113529.1 ATP-dependent DNA helicase [candidate division WOR-3 bacterium]